MTDSESQDDLPDPILTVESEIDESETTIDTPVEKLTAENRNDGFCQISDAHPMLERNIGIVVSCVLLVGVLIAAAVMSLAFEMTSIMSLSIYGGCFAFTFVISILMIAWPAIEHRHTWWRLNEDGLEIRRGVIWKHQICVPLARVQHADVLQGPLQRRYELGSLTVNTAGTQNASVSLIGLSHEMAVELRDQLIRQGKTRHVV
jgi:membrane protein YdbS with pleckstrin-like domain